MTPPSGTIDLGELPSRWGPEPDPWPVPTRRWRWRNRRTWRLAGAAATGMLVLTTTVAAAGQPQPALALALTVRAADYNAVADEDHLYVFDHPNPAGTTVVAAYRLADGTVAWRTPLPDQGATLTRRHGDALLVGTYRKGASENGSVDVNDRITGLDRTTGRPLWTRSGWPVAPVGDRMLLSRSLPATDPTGTSRSELSLVDMTTGAAVWSVEADRWQHDPAGTVLATLDDQGTLATYDLATGEQLAAAPTGAPRDPGLDSYELLSVLGSLVLIDEEVDGELVMSAYDATTLERRWMLANPARPRGPFPWPVSCGELVCLLDFADPPRAVDPGSGRTVWSADWLQRTNPDTGYNLFTSDATEPAGYGALIAYSSRRDRQHSWLVDLTTGEPVLDMRQWEPSGWYDWGSWSATTTLIWTTETGTWVGAARPDLSGIEPLGRIQGATLNEYGYGTFCSPVPAYVICVTDIATGNPAAGTSIQVWRLP